MVEAASTSDNKQDSAVKEEPISPEELLEIGIQLRAKKDEPADALKILKILDRKQVTAKLLIDTKIGKCLTAVNEEPDPEKASLATVEHLKEVVKMKEHLKTKWKKIHAEYKNSKEAAK